MTRNAFGAVGGRQFHRRQYVRIESTTHRSKRGRLLGGTHRSKHVSFRFHERESVQSANVHKHSECNRQPTISVSSHHSQGRRPATTDGPCLSLASPFTTDRNQYHSSSLQTTLAPEQTIDWTFSCTGGGRDRQDELQFQDRKRFLEDHAVNDPNVSLSCCQVTAVVRRCRSTPSVNAVSQCCQ